MWTDATTYSRGSERVQTAWELKLPSIRIYITNGHLRNKGVFTMHCYELGFDTYDLHIDGANVEQAKEKAINLCKGRVNNYALQLNSLK